MWNLVSLDGFFQDSKDWGLDWHEYVWGEELERISLEQLKRGDMLVFGRKTYEGMYAYWLGAKGEIADLMNGIRKIVVSKSLEKAEWGNSILVKGDVAAELARLKAGGDGEMLIFGSAELSSTLMTANLIDEYRLCLVPVVLGGGTPLFKPSSERFEMKLIEARSLRSGAVLLFYGPAAERRPSGMPRA
jgi:dihydrofolate reductase